MWGPLNNLQIANSWIDFLRGNVIDHFPYEVGKPCSKCASGNGFCYKNLCSKYIAFMSF